MALTNPLNSTSTHGAELLAPDISSAIYAGVAQSSVIATVATPQFTTSSSQIIPVVVSSDDPSFVPEGGVKPSGGITFSPLTVTIKKLAEIVVLSDELVRDAIQNPQQVLDGPIRQGFSRQIDANALGFKLGTAVTTGFDTSLKATSQSQTVAGTAPADGILAAIDTLNTNGYNADTVILSNTFKSAFLSLKTGTGSAQPVFGFGAAPDNIYGARVVYTPHLQALSGSAKTVGFVLDSSMLKYIVRTQLEVSSSNQAMVGGVSLWETNQQALRYEQALGFNVADINRAVVALKTA